MKFHVFSLETGKVIEIINGKDNAECESLFAERYNSNDYGATYADVDDKGRPLAVGSKIED